MLDNVFVKLIAVTWEVYMCYTAFQKALQKGFQINVASDTSVIGLSVYRWQFVFQK